VIAFVFPGQGSQKVGMGRALADGHPECRAVFDEADRALGEPLSTLCFEGPDERLVLTENTQPAILTVSVAAWRLLDSRGIRPDIVAGHSLGEYSAHVAAGTLAFADAVRTVRRRGRYMQEAVPVGTGAMAAILGLDRDDVAAACADAAEGDAPFHCALMRPAEQRLAPELRALTVSAPRMPVVANVDAAPKVDAAAAVEALIRQISAPVLWEDVVARLASEGVRAYVEVGPGTVLSGLIRKIHRDARVAHLETPADLEAVERLVQDVTA
jgi:[acyl-carrier-protein] S-malonyltransferase